MVYDLPPIVIAIPKNPRKAGSIPTHDHPGNESRRSLMDVAQATETQKREFPVNGTPDRTMMTGQRLFKVLE